MTHKFGIEIPNNVNHALKLDQENGNTFWQDAIDKENMKLLKLKNVYTGEIVLCKDLKDITEGDGKVFVKVFKEENPNRTFLVNREAFTVLNTQFPLPQETFKPTQRYGVPVIGKQDVMP